MSSSARSCTKEVSVTSGADLPPGVSQDRLTLRSVVVGLVLVVAVVFAMVYSEYVLTATSTNYSHFPIFTFLTFMVLVLVVRLILRAMGPGWEFSRSELFVILIMLMVAGLIPSNGLTGFLLVVLASPYYFADSENRWAEFLHSHIPKWMVPKDMWAMKWFFEGLPEGQSIPWTVWLVPLFWWLLLAAAITFATLAVMVILRRQWSQNERLVYPLVSVPAALTSSESDDRQGSGSPGPALLRNRLFWLGAGVSFSVLGWNMLSYLSPTIPQIPLKNVWFGVGRGFPGLEWRLNFFVLGFAYFANVDVLLSIWFFRVVYMLQAGISNRLGVATSSLGDEWSWAGLIGWQSFGALTAVVLWGLWVARSHLRNVLGKAFGHGEGVDDSDEIMGYRTAVWGLLLSVGLIVAWLLQAGMELKLIVAYLTGLFILYVGLSRIVAESGLVYVQGPMSAQVFATGLFGSAGLSQASLTTLGFSYATISQGKGLFAPGLAQIAKMGEFVRGNRRALLGVVLMAFAAATIASLAFTLYFGYRYGAFNFDTWHFRHGGRWIFTDTVSKMRNVFPPDLKAFSYMGVGAGIMSVLTLLRMRLPWWPLHPIGLAINGTYFTQKTFVAIFIAWLVKIIILKMGGVSLYRRSQPFFIGILVGYGAAVTLSTVIDYLYFFGDGHYIHSV